MARQNINIGAYANDGTGDDLRSAFEKVNANIAELYSTVNGANIGSTPPVVGVEQGELWWSTVEGRMYVRYGSVWVDASPSDRVVNYDLTSASTTGGANLQLTGTNLSIDTIKFASSTNITVTKTDANTITLSSVSYTGDVTGNLTGNVTGNLTGNVTGTVSGNAGTVTNGVYTTDTGTVTNAMLAGSIADSKLSTISTAGKVSNSATTATSANTTSAIVARDASGNFTAGTITAALTGNVTGNVTGSSGSTTGNAATATKLSTPRNINSVAFDGTADITVTADANTLSGTTLKSTVISSSLTSVGTLTNLTVTNTITGSVNGNAGTVSSIATHALSELSDVASTSPANGQVLTWNTTSSSWIPAASTGGLTQVQSDTSPLLGGNLGLNGHHIYGPGDVQTTVFGVSVEALNSLVSLLLESNSLGVNLGTFTQPTGYQSNTNGYTLDMGFFSDDPIENNIDFGTFV